MLSSSDLDTTGTKYACRQDEVLPSNVPTPLSCYSPKLACNYSTALLLSSVRGTVIQGLTRMLDVVLQILASCADPMKNFAGKLTTIAC